LVPASKALAALELRSMVQEINSTQIPAEEILSNHVYMLSIEQRGFCMI
jgi:hypothetical protein